MCSDSHGSGLADQIEVDNVALSVRIRDAWPGVLAPGCRKEGCDEFLRIGWKYPDRGEYSRLISASWMIGVQAVPPKLLTIDDRTVAIRQLHLPTSLTDRHLLTICSVQLTAWAVGCITEVADRPGHPPVVHCRYRFRFP
jgi:hypothetical protein